MEKLIYADLHIHTSYSDGTQTPDEIVQIAKKKKLDAISICDHNTIGAYEELLPLCAENEIRLIQGVELSVHWNKEGINHVLHLLAYNFNPHNAQMLELINETHAELNHWSTSVVVNLKRNGFPVKLSEYNSFEKNPRAGGWKCLYYLNEKGILPDMKTWRDLYEKYADPPVYRQIVDACRIIKNADGVAVLAHPERRPGKEYIDTDNLSELKSFGLMGIECYYPSHSLDLTELCVDFCRENNMLITSGGDGHGSFLDKVYPNENGVIYDIGIMNQRLDKQYLKGIIN